MTNLSQNVSELYRLVSQLQVKAMLYVANASTVEEKEARAGKLNASLNDFINQNLNYFQSQPGCGANCHWDDGLQMCVCDGGFLKG